MADQSERIAELERENQELADRVVELQRAKAPPRMLPALLMVAGAIIGVAGVFAINVLAMLAGLVMLSAAVMWGRQL